MARIDLGRAFAITWLVASIGVTLLIGPHLGWRGLAWLGLQDLICAAGAGHELWRKRGR